MTVALDDAYGSVGIADVNVCRTGISSKSPVFTVVLVPVRSTGAAVATEVLSRGAVVVGVDVRVPVYRMVVNLSFFVERMRLMKVALAAGVVPTEVTVILTFSVTITM